MAATQKLSTKMVEALQSAVFNPNGHGQSKGAYVVYGIHPRTRKALHDRGLMHGHYYLTRTGVEALAELAGNTVDMTGYEWDGDMIVATVTIQGEYVEAEDAHAHIAEQTAWMTQEGVCVGLCAVGTGCEHCDEQYGPGEPEMDAESLTVDDLTPNGRVTYAYYANNGMDDAMALRKAADMCGTVEKETQKEESTVEKIETVCVVQNWAGTVGVNHYHAPGCRDIQREAKRFGARDGLGMYSYSFATVADILTHEYADICEDAAEMLSEANSDYAGIRIMPCLSIPAGRMGDSPLVTTDNFFRLGFDQPSPERVAEIRAEIDAHECDDAECITCTVRDMNREDNDPGNAGFVETQDVEPLAEWEKELLEGVENSRSTGVTQHSITSDGKQWESFQHVLNAGDIVRVAGMQGVYEVHCLIPGLPTVYVLGTSGEPFPVSATAAYAI